MRSSRFRPSVCWCIGLGIALGGCGGAEDDLPRRQVSGSVSLDGEPLKSGTITLTPKDLGRPDAVAAGGVIIDGKFAIDRAKGPTPGTYLVSIFSGGSDEGLPPGEAPGMPPRPSRDSAKVPEKYNTRSTLVAEVTADGPNRFDYELASE